MSLKVLRAYTANLKGTSQDLMRRLWVDFHYKIALPFTSFIVILIGVPLAMKAKPASAMVGLGTSLGVVLVYYAANSVCLAMGKGGTLPPLLAAWLSNVFFAGVGIYLIKNTA